jgi:hypothetical protein
MKKIAFVLTTINVPSLFDGYIENMSKYGHLDDVHIDFVVVGDTKTPDECGGYVKSLKGENYEGVYLGIEDQKEFLKPYPELEKLLPYKSVQRRNIGTLLAYQRGNDVIIQLDDDNFSTEDDWVKYFSFVGESPELDNVESSSGWFNICSFLKLEPQRTIYHRGYPHDKRWGKEEHKWGKVSGKRIVVNAGLWLESPDVDALTHLDGPTQSLGFLKDDQPQVALAKGTWSPFNTQNTAFHRDLVPAMYCLVMCKEVSGVYVERYDDIWLSYFVRKIADHMDDIVVYGRPLAAHRRNLHNLVRDMKTEADGIIITNKLIKTLDAIELNADNYLDCYKELIAQLKDKVASDDAYTENEKAYLDDLTDGMQIWADVCTKIIK